MQQGEPQISLVGSGTWMSDTEQGSYYSLGAIGIWIEIQVQERHSPSGTMGALWTIDGWKSYHDTLGFCKQSTPDGHLWRIEIPHLLTIGWRDGSIGGPNGEQPSGKVWTLWGPDRTGVRCLPWGSPVPVFEFALFMKNGDAVNWNNNQCRNFCIDLSSYTKKP